MPFVCLNPDRYLQSVVGDGQCAVFVEKASGAPSARSWKQGVAVKGAAIQRGTAIATFVNGRYPNQSAGNHAAIYEWQDENGVHVIDQWVNQPVHRRELSFSGKHTRVNDGNAFSVIEHV